VDGDLAVVTTELLEFEAIGRILGVLAGSVVAVVANGTFKRKIWSVFLSHYVVSPSCGMIRAAAIWLLVLLMSCFFEAVDSDL
jgi:hypothetical protein